MIKMNYKKTFPYNTNRFYIDGKIFKSDDKNKHVDAKILFDTGASVTIINEHILNALGITVDPSNYIVSGLTGSTSVNFGIVRVVLSDDFEFSTYIRTTKNMNEDMILGMESLNQMNKWSIGRSAHNDVVLELEILAK